MEVLHLQIKEGDGRLGLELSGSPPDPIFIKEVEAQSWAMECGVEAHSVLLSIQCQPVENLPEAALLKLLEQQRPLSMTIVKPMSVQEEGIPLGLHFARLPPDKVIIGHVDKDTWADEEGVEVGDELLAVNGILSSKISKNDFQRLLKSVQLPLALTFVDPHFDYAKAEKSAMEELKMEVRRMTLEAQKDMVPLQTVHDTDVTALRLERARLSAVGAVSDVGAVDEAGLEEERENLEHQKRILDDEIAATTQFQAIQRARMARRSTGALRIEKALLEREKAKVENKKDGRLSVRSTDRKSVV